MLRRIRDELSMWLPQATDEPVRRFNHELAFLNDHREPDQYDPATALADDGEAGAFDRSEDARQWVERIFTSFRLMLTRITEDEPLLIALDHPGTVDIRHFSAFVLPYLLQPISQGKVANLQFLLVERSEWLRGVSDVASGLLQQRFTIGRFASSRVRLLILEYLALRGFLPVRPDLLNSIDTLRRTEGDLTGVDLRNLMDLLDRVVSE
jgi:hypothetical protein